MKRFLTCLSLAAALIYLNAGCKKQISPEEKIIITDTASVYYPPADPAPITTGALIAKVMPEIKFSLLLYNDVNSYEAYTIVDRNGAFMLKNIKAGEYQLVIQPADPAYNSFELSRIMIDSGRTTNLGLIFLP
ncbi:MAG: carboxypeptidase-like regulatory domain-containing protein [Chitinophagaceae bacterium]